MIPSEFMRMEMANVNIGPVPMRVIVFEFGGLIYGQCLDRDIMAQACCLDELVFRLSITIEAECSTHYPDGLESIAPAPPEWQKLWAGTLH